ncbi:MAG: hypothetical protein G01um10148_954 [Parcubacteria group bacterium Gr01-1014_8]|nr:MAG: hypothetical protein G01um10148_954 [Parcubacteria group bacterium Gr01-1014_8]
MGALSITFCMMHHARSVSLVFVLAALLTFSVFAPTVVMGDSITSRLCERQHSVGIRLARLLIDPEICNPAPPPATILDFSASPPSIEAGQSSLLSWDSTNATSCTASDGWSGGKSEDGTQSVSPAVTTAYTLSCTGAGGTVTKSATVTVTAAPIAPTLTLVKDLPNDSGGNAVAADFQAKIDGVNVPWSSAQTVSAGPHTASEVTLPGYTASVWGGDCAEDGTITLANGENKTCSITNDDQQATMTVIKHVINDNATPGTATAADFAIFVQGVSKPGSESGTIYNVNPGSYVVAEVLVSGYEGISSVGDCAGTIALGEHKTCTITNGDIAPELPTVLFSADPLTVHEGSLIDATSTLTWDSTNADSCVASNGWSGAKVADGAEVVQPTATTSITYVITCSGPGGTVAGSATLAVVPPAAVGKLLITEVLYDVDTATQGAETADEWVELFNGTDAEIDLTGYALKDNNGTIGDAFPQGTIIPANGFLVVLASDTTAGFWSIPQGTQTLVVDGDIGGNGLANGGDRIVLHDAQDAVLDSVSWGTDETAFAPSVHPDPTSDDFEGSSIGRTNNTTDTGAAADWEEKTTPTPGA